MRRQERSEIAHWIVGFTDGEGCFSVSMFKNSTSKFGWQVFPEFVITQGAKSLPALKLFESYFGCGRIFMNKRYDNHHEHLYRYCVRSVEDLEALILPFFRMYPLKTAKQKDFILFAEIVRLVSERKHLSEKGLALVARKIEHMNRKKKSQFLKSQETKRHAPSA